MYLNSSDYTNLVVNIPVSIDPSLVKSEDNPNNEVDVQSESSLFQNRDLQNQNTPFNSHYLSDLGKQLANLTLQIEQIFKEHDDCIEELINEIRVYEKSLTEFDNSLTQAEEKQFSKYKKFMDMD
ncbi:hypothetical protein BC833DRAFT_573987 [Globomyces pollinis-pini]|nr:hypothetical protein BC833DRAFT_573987 [Globomyces pollinis-pini]